MGEEVTRSAFNYNKAKACAFPLVGNAAILTSVDPERETMEGEKNMMVTFLEWFLILFVF